MSDLLGGAVEPLNTRLALNMSCMADHTEFVPVEVAEVRAIVVGVVLRPKTWRALRVGAELQSQRIGSLDELTRRGHERNHLAIAA